MPGANADAFFGAGNIQGIDQVIQVRERLTHAHDDDVCQPLLGRQEVSQADELFQNLANRQVSLQAIQTARTKDASHSAADLRADAGGVPFGLLNEHTLNELAVLQSQEQLMRPIAGLKVAGYLGAQS